MTLLYCHEMLKGTHCCLVIWYISRDGRRGNGMTIAIGFRV